MEVKLNFSLAMEVGTTGQDGEFLVPPRQVIVPACTLEEIPESELISILAKGLGINPQDFESFRREVESYTSVIRNMNACNSDEELASYVELIQMQTAGVLPN